jgi:hypothetical protein
MTVHTRPKQTLSKAALARYRQITVPDWQKTDQFRLLEQKYGKYLYIPLNIPPIVADDPVRFKEWFLEKSKPTVKRMADIANPDQVDSYAQPSFLAIDSKNILDIWKTKTWDVNPVSDMYEVFPEIKQKIDAYMPFETLEYYTLWSSLWPVSPHRDEHPLCDMPFAFRISLYDENPEGTLKLHKGLPDLKFADCESKLIEHFDSNAFVWNNLRTLHSSTKNSKFMKILMIVSPTYKNKPDYNKLEALFESSIKKYKNSLWEDTNKLEDYINADITIMLIRKYFQ